MPFTFFTFLTSARRFRAFTICGWTPSLRTVVATRVLGCGCVAGVYETWSGARRVILDARHEGCREPHHALDAVIER